RLLTRISQLGRSGPTWRFDLEKRQRVAEPRKLPEILARQAEVDAARRMAFHPVVVGDQALVADARYITAYDLRTGKASTWYDLDGEVGGVQPTLGLPAPPDLRYTITVAEDCVFARMGCQTVRDVRPGQPNGKAASDTESVLVSLSLKAQRGNRQRWR